MSIALFTAMETKKNVLYIDTGGSFSATRVKDMLELRHNSLTSEDLNNVLSKISVIQAYDVFSVIEALERVKDRICKQVINIVPIWMHLCQVSYLLCSLITKVRVNDCNWNLDKLSRSCHRSLWRIVCQSSTLSLVLKKNLFAFINLLRVVEEKSQSRW